jgi:hypothetical protein
MDETANLRDAIEDLQARLREEVQRRMELERRCHLLEKLAYRDPTTGLRTETYLRARVEEEILRSIRYPSATSLITVCAPQDRIDSLAQLGRRLNDELRTSDHVFGLSNNSGLAILLVETPEEGARRVLDRITSDLDQFVRGYGYAVTSFPVDTNLSDDFLNLALERHGNIVRQVQREQQPQSSGSSAQVH